MFIYAIEGTEGRQKRMRDARDGRPDAQLAISPLVQLECRVKPKRTGDFVLESEYEALLSKMLMLSFNDETWARATELRARFGLKTPDALHLACTPVNGCLEFWTNDDRLSRAAMGLTLTLFPIAAS